MEDIICPSDPKTRTGFIRNWSSLPYLSHVEFLQGNEKNGLGPTHLDPQNTKETCFDANRVSYGSLDPGQLGTYSKRDDREPPNACPRTMVAIDIEKAFDTLPHATIIRAAERRRLRGRVLNFIKSLLKERQFQVIIGSAKGKLTPNNVGIPQEAVV